MSTPKWAEKPAKDNKKHEQAWARQRQGRAQPSSGRFWHAKFDVKDDELLTDNKQTERLSYTVKLADWKALTRAANREGLEPCLQITFLQESGDPVHLVVLPAEMVARRNSGKRI